MARIAVDIDSTLYDFETPAREAFTKLARERGDRSLLVGAYHAWTEWRAPADASGLDVWLEAIALCHSPKVIQAQTPFKGAVDTCTALVNEGHELLYISNRTPDSAEATFNWLWDCGFPIDRDNSAYEPGLQKGGNALVCLTGEKTPWLYDCQYLIDDRPKTCVDFIYDYEWEDKTRTAQRMIRAYGPGDDSFYRLEFDSLIEQYPNGTSVPDEVHARMRALTNKAADEYADQMIRRAFVIAYPYNQNLTDIPHLYLAPTWAGLNEYMVRKGVLSEVAYEALSS